MDRKVYSCQKKGLKIAPKKLLKKRKLVDIIIDNKCRLAMRAYDLIDDHIRLIDEELNALDKAILHCSSGLGVAEVPGPVLEDPNTSITSFETQKVENEPVYCLCRKISHGEMIACDNEDCLIEWFHFPCVGLTKLPRKGNKWYCPDCTATMKNTGNS